MSRLNFSGARHASVPSGAAPGRAVSSNLARKLRLILPGMGYLFVSLIATWPLATHLKGWVPGLGDWGQNLWALWWTRQSLLALGQSPFFTNYLFFPDGVTLLFHPLDVADGLLALPLYGLLGGEVTYNLMILLSFALGGWGAYLLALYLTGHRGASFIAGLIFVLSPYHFQRIDLGHLNLSTLQWLPFYTLFLLRFVQRGSKRDAALAIFFLVFTALHSWYYVVYCGLLSVAIIFWPHSSLVIRHLSFVIRRSLFRVGIVLLAALLILTPLLLPMFQLLGSTTLVGAHNPLRHSVDLFSFWVPGPPSTWASWFEDIWISYAAQNREPGASAYFGYVVFGLAVLGILGKRWRRQALWWLCVAVGFTLLALGPQLQIDGQPLDVSLPYQWLANLIPLFSITGIPGRFVVVTSLALAMLAAYGLANVDAWLFRRKSQPGSSAETTLPPIAPVPYRPILLGVIILLIGLEYSAIPLRLTETEVMDFYQVMAADETDYAILDIKWDANFLMHAQTVHGKPLVGGWLARLPEEQAAYLDQEGLDRAFLYLLLGPEGATMTDVTVMAPAVQTALAEHKVRYIIDHGNLAAPWLERLVGWPVVYEADGVVVYGN